MEKNSNAKTLNSLGEIVSGSLVMYTNPDTQEVTECVVGEVLSKEIELINNKSLEKIGFVNVKNVTAV